ncbi:MAG: hypothetical protein LAO23_23640 [Acidobacteriia bacterium]|nr:hypothetical protein [Terriglobia bacterium]
MRAQNATHAPTINRLSHLNTLATRLGPGMERRLSAGGANMFHLGKVLSDSSVMRPADMSAAREVLHRALARSAARAQAAPFTAPGNGPPLIPVSDSSLDYLFSRISGFTQSETSTAWCGNNVVVGFNDSGADVRTFVEQVGGASFSGVAVSHNGGRSFAGLPFLNPGSDPGTFLGGDPVVACSDPSNFLYASLLSHATFDDQGNVLAVQTGIAVNRSRSGGLLWDPPVTAVVKDGSFNFLDKEWMAIDGHNPNNIYITYTNFADRSTDPACPPLPPTGRGVGPVIRIEIVSSKDGGASWSSPRVLGRVCNTGNFDNLSGSQVVVGPSGEVYVAYSRESPGRSKLLIRRSTNGGRTFTKPVVVGKAAMASAVGSFLQGGFRFTGFPSLAVDNFPGPNRGTLYMVWTDASRNSVPDFFTFQSKPYAFGDIVLSKSRDGGTTWSTPTVVSPVPSNFTGAGRDQFMAGVAVDVGGNLAVCYSDRREDPNNFLIDHFCSVSHDQGATFQDIRETRSSWAPDHRTDFLISPRYMGDYDTVSSDTTGSKPGFFSSFQVQNNGNPDVFGFRLVF